MAASGRSVLLVIVTVCFFQKQLEVA
jgi:hypothetical protein